MLSRRTKRLLTSTKIEMPRNMNNLLWTPIALLILWAVAQRAELLDQNSYYDNPQIYYSLNKVSLTQKGYIQFLRYIADVPVITEFTFCIWMKSANLTYAHPLLSYSKHEEKRYIRAWISPHGNEINLAILENEVFKVPARFREHRWYHICNSWDSHSGFWSLHLNGKLKISSYEPKLAGLKIPEGGDIVVGQEYTDFDKGFDDGIEGDIFGFNMVLESTVAPHEESNNFIVPYEFGERRILVPSYNSPRAKPPGNPRNKLSYYPEPPRELHSEINLQPQAETSEEVPSVLSYFSNIGANRSPKSFLDVGQEFFQSLFGWFEPPPQPEIRIKSLEEFNREGDNRMLYFQNSLKRSVSGERANKRIISGNARIVNDIAGVNHKPLGLQLVELSHNCALGKGSPINHEKVLVSWTKTPVRVFGGAILKNIPPFCFKT